MPTLLMGAMAARSLPPAWCPKWWWRCSAAWSGATSPGGGAAVRVLHLINTMLFGAGFPEGFRAAMELRGFRMGESRQPLAPGERCNIEALRQVLHELLKEFDPDPLVPPPPVSPVCATQGRRQSLRAGARRGARVLLRLRQEGSR